MSQADAFLELCSIGKNFGDHPALVDCNLTVRRGEFVTLLGPSGCGKTTTLRVIAGFLRPDSGELRLDGRVLSSQAAHTAPEARNMGMVFQSFAVWPHMTVFDNVALPLRIRGASRDEVKRRCGEVFRLCRLEQLMTRDPHQLSGGQLQRVALARALVYRPSLLLLDEPLSNLDAALREEMRRELHSIHQAIQTTFILVTHDQVEAMSLSDRVVVMNNGRIEQIGTPSEIYRKPKTSFVAHFVGAANLLDGKVTRLPGTTDEFGQVQIQGMTLDYCASAPQRLDSTCTVAIHSESIQLGTAPNRQAGSNRFEGRVREVYFLGRTQEIVVEVNGVELRTTRFHGGNLSSDDVVEVFIPPSDVLLV